MPKDSLDRELTLARAYLDAAATAPSERAWRALCDRRTAPALARLQARLDRWTKGASPRLADRIDLLLLLLNAPGRTGRAGEGVLGVTRLLKLLFVAGHELGADALSPAPYAFVPYKFGPFCGAVYDDVSVLVRAGLIRRVELDDDGEVHRSDDLDEGLPNNGANVLYRLTRKGQEFARALEEPAARKRRNILAGLRVVKTELASMPLRDLLRYVYSRYPEYATESEILKRVLGR
ncbi:MAG: hypothetical protein R6X13_00480 [bacterium]